MIFTEGLTKRFGTTHALDGLDLVVEPGTILGLLGRNGAGKTTAVRILATLLLPDGGRALVGGHDVVRDAAAVREQISLAGQQATLDERLTGRENLVLLGRLQRLSAAAAKARAAELLERFGLTDAATRLVSTYSGGMRRRLDLAACLMVPRPVVFLDEPTTGLDPVSRTEVWNAIRALADDGAAILLTTQYLAEAEHLADRVSVLDGGRVAAEGTPAELKARVGERRVEAVFAAPETVAAAIAALAALGLHAENGRGARVSVPAPSGADDLTAAVAALTGAGIEIEEASLHRPTLDDAFAALTGR
jgi:ABC-2 type transport system ATP-binding protein